MTTAEIALAALLLACLTLAVWIGLRSRAPKKSERERRWEERH